MNLVVVWVMRIWFIWLFLVLSFLWSFVVLNVRWVWNWLLSLVMVVLFVVVVWVIRFVSLLCVVGLGFCCS